MIVEIYVFYWRDIEIGIEIEMCLLKIWFLIELALCTQNSKFFKRYYVDVETTCRQFTETLFRSQYI